MDTRELLREALVDLRRSRDRERRALRESNALLEGLEGIARARTPEASVDHLLHSVQRTLEADAVLLLQSVPGDPRAIDSVGTTDPSIGVSGGEAASFLTRRRRRIVELGALDAVGITREASAAPMRSLLSAPSATGSDRDLVLACLSEQPYRFSADDARLLDRFVGLAVQALTAKQMAERNALLAAVIDGSSTSIAISDADAPDQPLIYVNDAFEIMTGFDREEVLGSNCRLLSAEPQGSPERTRLGRAVRARDAGQFEVLNRRKDGEPFWNKLTLYPVEVGESRRTYMVATQEDVTQTREAQIQRDAARTELMSALSSTREGFLVLDRDGTVTLANARFRDFFGTEGARWQSGASFTHDWRTRLRSLGVSEAEAQAQSRALLASWLGGARDQKEVLPDGRTLLINATPMPEGGCVCIATDVTTLEATERKLAERAVAIDTAQDGIAMTDAQGRFVYLNPSHVTMFGYDDPSELIGQSWRVLYAPDRADHIERIAMPEVAAHGRWRGDVTGLRKDGTTLEQDVSLTLLDGVGLICVTRDISDRIRGEAERARLRDQLEAAQRQEAIGQLAAGMAHDFNNVLSVINGSARLMMLEDPALVGSAHLKRISNAGEQASRLVSRILDLGKRASDRVWADLCGPFSDAVELARNALPGHVELRLDMPGAPLFARFDSADVLQIVLNLIINARDAIGAGGGTIAISLSADTAGRQLTPRIGSCQDDAEYVRIRVEDTGAGMAAAEIDSAFTPFFSTKGRRGTGLGLAVVSGIVTEYGGAIDVRSAPGQGTAFDVYLPTDQAPQAKAPATERPLATTLRGMTAIVVDDDAEVAETLAQTLELHGAEVATCLDPRDAIAAIAEDPGHWDVLVTDFDMPGMTGEDLARQVRDARQNLGIVLCTALPDWQNRANAAHDLFDAVLSKPVDPDRLVQAIAGTRP